ncbi:MAG TPA: isoamylase early set domain-containing protein [Clostridia bacterium]|nr:isoamylase early set domain-containing protein [Clostridia bacterium]
MSTLIKSKSITVRFQFHDDHAKSVCIAGTFNDWHPKLTPMVTSGSGQWSQELALSPGIYEYQYVVDGRWINDPQAVKSTPNPFGGRNSVLIVEQDNMKAVASHGRPSAFMKPSEKRRQS